MAAGAPVTITCDLSLAGPYGSRKKVVYPLQPPLSFYAVNNATGTKGQVPNYIIAPSGLTHDSYCLTVRARVVCTDAHLPEAAYADQPPVRHLGIKDGSGALYQALNVLDPSGSAPSLVASPQLFRDATRPASDLASLHERYTALEGPEVNGVRNHIEETPGVAGLGPRWKVTHLGTPQLSPGVRYAAATSPEGTSAFRVLDVSRIAGALMPRSSIHTCTIARFAAALRRVSTRELPHGQALNDVSLSIDLTEAACEHMPAIDTKIKGVSRSTIASRSEEEGFLVQVRRDARICSLAAREVALLSVYSMETILALSKAQRTALLALLDECPLILASPHTVASLCAGVLHFRPHLLAQLAGVPTHRLARTSGEAAMTRFLADVEREHVLGRRYVYSDQAVSASTARALSDLGLIRTSVEGTWPNCACQAELTCVSANYLAATRWIASVSSARPAPAIRTQSYGTHATALGNMIDAAAECAASGGLVITSRFDERNAVVERVEELDDIMSTQCESPIGVVYYRTHARRIAELAEDDRATAWCRHIMTQAGVTAPPSRVMFVGADHLDDAAFVEAVGVAETFLRAVGTGFTQLRHLEFAITNHYAGGRAALVVAEASPSGCFPGIASASGNLAEESGEHEREVSDRSLLDSWATVPSEKWNAFLSEKPCTGSGHSCPPLATPAISDSGYLPLDCPRPDLVLYTGPALDEVAALNIARRCAVAQAGRDVIYVADTCELFHLEGAREGEVRSSDEVTLVPGKASSIHPTVHSQPRECCVDKPRAPGQAEKLRISRHDVRFGMVHAAREYRGPRVSHVVAVVMAGAVFEDLYTAVEAANHLTVIVLTPGHDRDSRMRAAMEIIGEMRHW